eukprot:PhF_6_TR13784/c0_g1_i1/m.22188
MSHALSYAPHLSQEQQLDQDFLIACCCTCCCSFLVLLVVHHKMTPPTVFGMISGCGCSLILVGFFCTFLAGIASSCERKDFQVNGETDTQSYDHCQHAIGSYKEQMYGLGIPCLVLGLIFFCVSFWRHSVLKREVVAIM